MTSGVMTDDISLNKECCLKVLPLSHIVPVQNAPRKSYGAASARVTVTEVARITRAIGNVERSIATVDGEEIAQ